MGNFLYFKNTQGIANTNFNINKCKLFLNFHLDWRQTRREFPSIKKQEKLLFKIPIQSWKTKWKSKQKWKGQKNNYFHVINKQLPKKGVNPKILSLIKKRERNEQKKNCFGQTSKQQFYISEKRLNNKLFHFLHVRILSLL